MAATGHRPVLLGLAGDSASGKSTLSHGVEYILGVERVARVCTDDYHRYDRASSAELGVTPLAPGGERHGLMASTAERSRGHRGHEADLRPPHGDLRAPRRRFEPPGRS